MKLVVSFSKQAEKFFKKNPQIISRDKALDLLKKATRVIILHQEANIDLKSLKGEYKGYYRIRYRDIRIIFTYTDTNQIILLAVLAIDFRGNVY